MLPPVSLALGLESEARGDGDKDLVGVARAGSLKTGAEERVDWFPFCWRFFSFLRAGGVFPLCSCVSDDGGGGVGDHFFLVTAGEEGGVG